MPDTTTIQPPEAAAQSPLAAISLTEFEHYRKARIQREEAQRWIAHIGASGRAAETLQLSPAHCTIKMTVAGQYDTGGKNYWETPGPLNSALITAIIGNWDLIIGDAMAALVQRERDLLVSAKKEIEAASAAVSQAEAAQ